MTSTMTYVHNPYGSMAITIPEKETKPEDLIGEEISKSQDTIDSFQALKCIIRSVLGANAIPTNADLILSLPAPASSVPEVEAEKVVQVQADQHQQEIPTCAYGAYGPDSCSYGQSQAYPEYGYYGYEYNNYQYGCNYGYGCEQQYYQANSADQQDQQQQQAVPYPVGYASHWDTEARAAAASYSQYMQSCYSPYPHQNVDEYGAASSSSSTENPTSPIFAHPAPSAPLLPAHGGENTSFDYFGRFSGPRKNVGEQDAYDGEEETCNSEDDEEIKDAMKGRQEESEESNSDDDSESDGESVDSGSVSVVSSSQNLSCVLSEEGRQCSSFETCLSQSARSDQGSDQGKLLTSPNCEHVAEWKRLRAKRGFGYYVCQSCGSKWKTASSSSVRRTIQ